MKVIPRLSIRKPMLVAVSFLGLCLGSGLVWADGITSSLGLEIEGAYDFPNVETYPNGGLWSPISYQTYSRSDKTGRTIGSSWGGLLAKAIGKEQWTIPMLQGSDDFTKGNNLSVNLSQELSPVSLNAGLQATLTPIAFLQFSVGGKVGTGWTLPGLGAIGLAVYDSGTDQYQASSFRGLVSQFWASGTFQFDLAALMPGDWNHVILVASPKLLYENNSLASTGQAWIWEADDGTDFNGWLLKGTYFLGYQMPKALDMIGIMAEPSRYLGFDSSTTVANGGWGSDAVLWTVSGVFDIKLSDKSNITILPQLQSKRAWTNGTTFNNNPTTRVFSQCYWYLYDLAFDYNLSL